MSVELESLIRKLNPVCRQALQKAAELCVSQTNYNVEIEHLFHEIIKIEKSDILMILKHYDIDRDKVSSQLEDAINKMKRGNNRTPAMSPEIVELFQEAWVVSSVRLGSNRINSGSLLVGLFSSRTLRAVIRESAPVLTSLSLESLQQNIAQFAAHSMEDGDAGSTVGHGQAAADGMIPEEPAPIGDGSHLEQFTVDITERVRKGEVDPIEGRDPEIRQIIDILTRRRQNNPILTGDAGVGKTAIVEGFAIRVVNGDVPPALQNISVRALDLGLLQAGAGVKGEFENRLKSVINEVKSSPQAIILFVDEAHTLIGAGGQAGQNDAANLLKPALARGELRTIAATTWAEYKKYFEKDHALVRRFQVIQVDEPDVPKATQMLRYVAAPLEKHHNVRILDEAVEAAVKLSHKYITGRKLPDKAIGLLDTACARVALAQNSTPAQVDDISRDIKKLEYQIELLERENITAQRFDSEVATLKEEAGESKEILGQLESRWHDEQDLVSKIIETRQQMEEGLTSPEEGCHEIVDEPMEDLKTRLKKLQDDLADLQKGNPMIPVSVDAETVAAIVSNWTGIPLGKMVVDEVETVLNLGDIMNRRLKGQDHALEMISRRIRTSRAQLDDPSKPSGVFMLVGPSGVGKTETALTLAEVLYGGEDKVISINMSEYQEAHTVSLLKGAPPGYVGYGTGGVLTEAVRRQPFSIVLLDEVEKAHPDVMELFYQVFDKGIIEDGEGVKVNFKDTIILLTSNIGTEQIAQACQNAEETLSLGSLEMQIKPELLKHFKPAFIGRLVVIPYLQLGDEQIKEIVKLKLGRVSSRFEEHNKAPLTFDDSLVDVIASRCTEVDTGARNIDNILTNTLLPELSEEVLIKMADKETINRIHVSIGDDGFFEYHFNDQLPTDSQDAMISEDKESVETDSEEENS